MRIKWGLYLVLISLLSACSRPFALAPVTPTPTFTSTTTATLIPTATAIETTRPTATPTNPPTPTFTPTLFPTDTPTSTNTPRPTQTPTVTPIPATPTPTYTPTPSVDFRIASWRLWPLELNSGCSKGMHSIFITVLDVAGNPLNDIVVGDTWNNVEVVTGSKGVGKAEINLWSNTMEVAVKGDIQGQGYTSEISFPFSSFMTTIPNEQMIQAGYCSNELECDWKRANDSYYCGGHYSWEVIFQKTY
ncbi:MAG: hypothetical protein AB1801_16285 [Chloroflexota bacterium]